MLSVQAAILRRIENTGIRCRKSGEPARVRGSNYFEGHSEFRGCTQIFLVAAAPEVSEFRYRRAASGLENFSVRLHLILGTAHE